MGQSLSCHKLPHLGEEFLRDQAEDNGTQIS